MTQNNPPDNNQNEKRQVLPRGITVSFTAEEIEWLHWVMTKVLTSEDIKNTAKEKLIEAHKLFVDVQNVTANKNVEAGK